MGDKKEPAPGGVRMPEYLRFAALSRVEDLMVQAYKPHDIVAKMIDEGFTDSEETVRKWRLEVQRKWALEDAELRPARKDLWRTRIEAQYHKLLDYAEVTKSELARASYFAEATKLTKLALIMDGLTAPVQHVHSGQVDVMALQPHERETEIEALLRKREEARQAAARDAGKVVH
jgi:hypothetical protein